ncbi:MAG: zinc ABC transporter solute-binding protein [Candidatus Aminicenantes bacterium]|nr:zinc ABC transporter solute-binding protein [Candidatus Aminicenantes bacterium]
MRALGRLLTAALCVSSAAAAAAPDRLRVLATVLPLREFTAAIAGDRAEVALLLPAGAGVHSWQPRPGDIARLAECDLLLFIGSGLEPWLPGLLKAMPGRRLNTLEAASSLALLDHADEGEGEEVHDHGALDPHVWLDFELDLRIVDRIAKELSRLDPAGTSAFYANAEKLSARLKALDARFRDGLAGCRGRDLVLAGHGAFGYLARRYGLVQRALYGLSPDSQPRPKDIMAAVDFCKSQGIRTVFFENSVPADLSRTLAREIGGRVLVLHAGHNLTRDQQERGVGFFELMEENLLNLRDGLGCR